MCLTVRRLGLGTALVLMALFAGCRSLDEFYRSAPGAEDDTIPYDGDVVLSYGKDVINDISHFYEQDFRVIGTVTVEGSNFSDDEFVDFAKRKRAQVAVLFKSYLRTVTGASPIVTPTSSTSTSYHTGMVGGAMFNGASHTTTTGTQTTYVPYSRDLYLYECYFLRKTKRPIRMGIFVKELEGEALKRAGTRKGVLVIKVVRDKAAWKADIFEGDILLMFDNEPILGGQEGATMLKNASSGPHKILLIRGNDKLEKTVEL